ncbi:hydrogen gas-evolving membrane-bound hydrogenase subunit E [Orenia marismortui]|uniref:hydrogen gas-evolving membrane-bound hydrogenase subunit E n=1 Tax=Orenia marismortui TaxID=46469 RepID=UPI00037A0CCE|nr:hydrogen gas-evolving membrane-bound hydrogenase subunit E [Orenia marismortui]
MRYIYVMVLILILALVLSFAFFSDFLDDSKVVAKREVSNYYIDNGVEDTGAINLVTAILFDYRAFDTLGEATVIFIVVSTISALASRRRTFVSDTNFSPIVYQGISFIIPFLYILGFYIIFYGHLSPGGGFTGGVILAIIFILLTITFGIRYSKEEEVLKKKALIENLGAVGLLSTGILGILFGSKFLANGQGGFNLGSPGELLSAGIIPILSLFTGIKVGAGLSIIFNRLVKEE